MANIALIKVEQCAENSSELSLLLISLLLTCNELYYHKRASAQVSPFPSEYGYSLIRGPKEEIIAYTVPTQRPSSEYDIPGQVSESGYCLRT